jgi:hypothetical protein
MRGDVAVRAGRVRGGPTASAGLGQEGARCQRENVREGEREKVREGEREKVREGESEKVREGEREKVRG